MGKQNKDELLTTEDLCDTLRNMLESRVENSQSIEEVHFCIGDAIEEWVGAYDITITGS